MKRLQWITSFICLSLAPAAGLSASPADTVSVSVQMEQRPPVLIRGLERSDVVFLALNDFISLFGLPSSVNESVRKIEFRLLFHRVKVTAQNPYLVITDLSSNAASVYQLPADAVLQQDIYYVPADEFVRAVSVLWPGSIAFDPVDLVLTASSSPNRSPFDITNVQIEPKLNGYLMTVEAARKLGDVEAWLKPDGWLFVTVANARADTVALSQLKPYGAIRRILVFQSPTSVQLTFKVAPDVKHAEVIADPETNNLLISLHTRSEAEKAELERQKQQMIIERLEKAQERWKLDVIVIDAGHGGKDPGTIGVAKTKEKDVALGVALKLGALIEKNLKGVKVVYTRKTDKFVELYRRAQIANEANGKLFVSIHCNSTERKPSKQNGFEIYLLRPGKTEDAIRISERENSVVKLEEGFEERYKTLTEENFILVSMQQSAFMKYSEQFASIAAKNMADALKIRNSGVRQAGFYVLVGASMPNVLVETGYLSNRNEEKVLKSSTGQQKIAEALFRGIREYAREYEKALREAGVANGSK